MRRYTVERTLAQNMKEKKSLFSLFKPNDTNTGLFSYPANLVMANTSTVTSALKAIYTIKESQMAVAGMTDTHKTRTKLKKKNKNGLQINRK